MRSTYTIALLPIPKAAWDFIAEAMEEAGYHHHITNDGQGGITVMFDMTGIGVIPTGDRDTIINSGRLSDLLVQANEHSFRAGFEAAKAAGASPNYYDAWCNYEPSDDILELQVGL